MTELAAQMKVWPLAAPFVLEPVPHSENRVYRLGTGDGGRYILRLHRPGYHNAIEVQSELAWIGALRRESGLLVPEVIATRDGQSIARITLPGETAPRLAVLFVENAGDLPDETDPRLPEIFEALGAATARCHLHVQTWSRPDGFLRPDWTIAGMIGRRGIWGDWRAAPDLSARDAALLMQAEARLLARFDAYGMASDRYGLIHNDLRPSNFLWDGGRVRLIDFDDCGFGWFIADFAASVSWFENDPRVPDLFGRWRKGYERHRTLTEADLAMAAPALMARRMLLLAWTASRAETDLAVARAQGFAAETVLLAQRYLDGERLT